MHRQDAHERCFVAKHLDFGAGVEIIDLCGEGQESPSVLNSARKTPLSCPEKTETFHGI
jgi:hypothetical protein